MPVSALLRRALPPLLSVIAALLPINTTLFYAQESELERCSERPRVITGALFVDYLRWCVESVIDAPHIEPFSFTALEVAPDGSLFATRPLTGRVMIIEDSDGDLLPDSMRVFADGLSLPNGLAYHDGMLYVAGGPHIYRVENDGHVETIVSDLPSESGFPVGGLALGEDGRLVAAIGAPCDYCEFGDDQRGAILSMTLDGADQQVIADGFRQPADIAFFRGQLWAVDSGPRAILSGALDELNIIEDEGWYGFPYCLGNRQVGIPSERVDCAKAIAPRVLFGSGARPISLAAYPHDTMTGTADTLVVALRGDAYQVDFVGYKVVMLHFDAENQPLGATLLLPFRIESGRQAYVPYREEGFRWREYITLSELGWGIYPQQPLALAVNARGWIYVSLTGGEIIALRPANREPPSEDFYPVWTPMHPDFDPEAQNETAQAD